MLVEAAATAVAHGICYAFSGVSSQVERIWALLWPAEQLPIRYPTARDGVLAAMARQSARRDRVCAAARRGGPGVAEPRQPAAPDAAPLARDIDRRLTERAQAGDAEAYRALVPNADSRYSGPLNRLSATIS